MAKITPKSKKVKGTKKKDSITWKSSSAKYKAISVFANNGNDVINFKKSKYKNKLYGQNGNDTIYGGKNNDYIDGGKGNDKLYGYSGNDKILGGAGNDIIYGGKGKDTVNAGTGKNKIYHNAGDGNDVIVNGKGTDTLVFTGVNSINDLNIQTAGNDVVITRANAEKITLKDYMKGGHSVKYIQAAKTKSEIIVVQSSVTANNKIVITPVADYARTVTITGSGNTLVEKGQNTQTININGENNNVSATNTGSPDNTDNRNTVVVASNNNTVTVTGGNGSKVNLFGTDNLTGNSVYINGGLDNKVFTSNNGETYVEATTDERGITQIKTYGRDTISLGAGEHNVVFDTHSQFQNDYNETINLKEDMSKVDIDYIYTPDSVNITQSLNTSPVNIMFEHYGTWTDKDDHTDHISVVYLDENYNVINRGKNELNFNGYFNYNDYSGWGAFNLDNPMVWDGVTITAQNGTDIITKIATEMSQYVDTTQIDDGDDEDPLHGAFLGSVDYSSTYGVNNAGTGILNIAKDVYVKGSANNDEYIVHQSCTAEPVHLAGKHGIDAIEKQYTIQEAGGTNDRLILYQTSIDNFKFFFDVDTQGNYGQDLYIIGTSGETSEFSKFINNENSNYILIKNQLKQVQNNPEEIEHIRTNGQEINTWGYTSNNELRAAIAGWLNDYNTNNGTEYGTVMEAIKDGAGDAALLAAYTTDAATKWNNSWSVWTPE
jgi:hypothetical protein